MYGLMAICHEAGKGGYIGSHWPNHARAVFLPDGAADKAANLGEWKSPWRQLLDSDA
jgi:hypothetical protein